MNIDNTFEPFLKIVAKDVVNRFESELENICMVFPSRRSIVYFYKYLSEIVDKPTWSPQCLTITDFYQKYSSLKLAPDIQLVAELYQVYARVLKTNEDFDNFYFWGERMLSDFDDMDKYRIDSRLLFKNLANYKQINELFSFLTDEQVNAIRQFWETFSQIRPSKEYHQFINLWQALPEIYTQFKQQLNDQGVAYEGMLYRQVVDKFIDGQIQIDDFKQIAFVGFNALNACDREIFSFFYKAQLALFYWDYNPILLNNTQHEAVYFIRNNIKEFPSALPLEMLLLNQQPNVEVIEIPSSTGQAKMIEAILNKNQYINQQPEHTAIILADETLLLPVLHAIPDSLNDINVTMGYPIKETPIFSLLKLVGRLHSLGIEDNGYYYPFVLDIIKHPYIQRFALQEANQLQDKIIHYSLKIIKQSELSNINHILLKLIFEPILAFDEYVKRSISIIGFISNNIISDDENENMEQPIGVEQESLSTVQTFLIKFLSITEKLNLTLSVNLGINVVLRALSMQKIPFEGEPLKGLQIMGFLESRALDYENIIILSVNEGVLPRAQVAISFIPYHLRQGFGMPTLEHHDAIYAYYFYRLLSRSKNVYLLYNSVPATIGNSERSRYISQLIFESSQSNNTTPPIIKSITVKPLTFQISNTPDIKISIKKNKEIISNLYSSACKQYLSSTSIFDYIECSLRFYYKYIARIRPKAELLEEMDAQLIGSILHESIKQIYTPFKNQLCDKTMFKKIIQEANIDYIIDTNIAEHYNKKQNTNHLELSGKDYIIREVLKKLIQTIFQVDSSYLPFTILSLEEEVKYILPVKIGTEIIPVNIGGRFDRIDEIEAGIRIVDYKTGNLDKLKIKSINEVFDSESDINNRKEKLQGLLYAYLYEKVKKPNKNVYSFFYLLRNYNDRTSGYLHISDEDTEKQLIKDIKPYIDEIENSMKNILEELFDNDLPYTQTEVEDRCKYCEYNQICMRGN